MVASGYSFSIFLKYLSMILYYEGMAEPWWIMYSFCSYLMFEEMKVICMKWLVCLEDCMQSILFLTY